MHWVWVLILEGRNKDGTGGALVLDEVPMWEVAVPEEVPVLYKILKGAMEGKL